MQVTRFTIRAAGGSLLDQARIVNAPDLADMRINNILKHEPGAIVEREDREDVLDGDNW